MSCGVMRGHMGWGVIEEGRRKGPWTAEEDRLLIEYVKLYGEGRWSSVARLAGLKRNGKSCRLRWVNYLRPDLKRGQITPHEESIILELHAMWGNRFGLTESRYGNRVGMEWGALFQPCCTRRHCSPQTLPVDRNLIGWSTIARSLPGRTDNEIKNYWRTHFKKKPKVSSNKTEKSKSCFLRRQQFNHQQQQQQQQQLNQVDAKKIVSLLDESENKVLTLPQGRQDMATICSTTAEEQGLFYSMLNGYGFVPEDSNEDFLWSGLWNLDNVHGNIASTFC